MKPLHILLYEDNQAYTDSFKLKAQKNRILVDAVNNVDSLFERLEVNPKKYQFIVLDARAFLREGQTSGTESEANLIRIFRDLPKIEAKLGRPIPHAINTGFADVKLSHEKVLECPIFDKGDEERLIKHIWDTFNNSEIGKIKSNFPEFIDFADAYFDVANYEVLVSLLKDDNFSSPAIGKRVTNLAMLRRVTECIMDIVHVEFLDSIGEAVNSRATRLNDIADYLNRREDIPTHIYGIIINIRKTANQYGSHTPEEAERIVDYPSHNVIRGYVWGLTDVIIWAKTKIEKAKAYAN